MSSKLQPGQVVVVKSDADYRYTCANSVGVFTGRYAPYDDGSSASPLRPVIKWHFCAHSPPEMYDWPVWESDLEVVDMPLEDAITLYKVKARLEGGST